MSAPAPPALRLARLTVRYDERIALQGVDLSVPAGQFVALAGPNGSGKTTLIRAALGFLEPSEGSVEILGDQVSDLSAPERARRAAWVPQEESPRDNVRVFDYVLYGRFAHLRPLEAESEVDREAARKALRDVNLGDRGDDGILSISGGERQRAILARALVQDAPLLLLDEPTSHLDIGHQLDLLGRVRELSRRRGVTVIAALHDLNLAARYADRIVVLSHGRKFADGPPSEVLSEELLSRVWGVVADLKQDPRTGLPYLLPHRLVGTSDPKAPGLRAARVHVVGGGGAAAPILRALTEAGYRVTAGALNLLDSDSALAEDLSIPTAVEAPFAPLGTDVRARHRELLGAAQVIVIAPIAVGPSNLANLEDASEWASRTPIVLVRHAGTGPWDFAAGRAEVLWDALRRAGGVEVGSIEELLERLRLLTPTVVA